MHIPHIWVTRATPLHRRFASRVALATYSFAQEIAVLEGHRDTVNCVSFTSDDSKIASGSADRTVRLWDTKQVSLLMWPYFESN